MAVLTGRPRLNTIQAVDSDLDWRPALGRVIARWTLVVTVAVAAAALAGALSLAEGDFYMAATLLVVAKPDAEAEFDTRLHAPESDSTAPYNVSNLRAYAELARTRPFAAAVRRHLSETAPDVELPSNLLRAVDVRALAEGSLIEVQARAAAPQTAALLANAWSELLASHAEEVYAPASVEDMAALRDEAATALAEADERLANERASSRVAALDAERQILQDRYVSVLRARHRLADVAGDLERLSEGGETGRAIGARLAAVALELSAVGAYTDTPVSLQLAPGYGERGPSLAEIAAIREALQESRDAADALAGHLPADIAAIEGELQLEASTLDRLGTQRELAEERYLTLSRRTDELEVLREGSRPELRPAFLAAPPSQRDYGPTARRTSSALVLGLAAGALLALLLPPTASSSSHASHDGPISQRRGSRPSRENRGAGLEDESD